MKDKPLTEIRIGEKSRRAKGQLQERKANSTKIATEFSSAAAPIFVNDLEQGVKYLMRKETEEVASPQIE